MKKIYITTFIIFSFSFLCSCNEDRWLKEEPKDFYTTDNSYETLAQYNQALNYLYDVVRSMHWVIEDANIELYYGDMGYSGTDFPDGKMNNMKAWITPYTAQASYCWYRCYSAITNANIILNRISGVNDVDVDNQKLIRGTALFFRAYFYNFLADLYGGVPLITEELTEPRRNFTRNTRQEVYNQVCTDLQGAVDLLADISSTDAGKISKQAALHLLAQAEISSGNYTKAIEAATEVIDNPNMALMTKRFGSRSDKDGDPYWDLFQLNNQNRSSGNTESIWVLQYEYQNSGSVYGINMPRYILPNYYNSTVESKDGNLVLAFTTFTAEKGGRGIGCIHPTNYFLNEVWGKDFNNDLRNSSRMIVRDFKIDNPKAKGFGQWMVKDGWITAKDTLRNFYPFVMKFSRVGYFPDASYVTNADGTIETTALGEHCLLNQNNSANFSFKDEYMYRLAGTYLLRAEAYIRNGQLDKAAEDINKLRIRANATPVQTSEINLDYLMDEQMRELYFEDFRVLTLCRMGEMVNRSKKYSPTGYNVGDYQNLYPIPYSEIENNVYGKIEQNPGYEGF